MLNRAHPGLLRGRRRLPLTPVLGTPVPEIGFIDPVNLEPKEVNRRQGRTFPYTPPFNFSGQPSLSLPLEMDANGLPIGMMFTAPLRRRGDALPPRRPAGEGSALEGSPAAGLGLTAGRSGAAGTG